MSNPNSRAGSPDVKNAISVLRALTVSRKGTTSINDLARDYRELEGAPLTYRKFGFKSIEDFLTSSGEFSIKTANGETFVVAKPSKDSAHITELIRGQKAPKRKKSSLLRQPKISGRSWNKSSYSQSVFQNLTSVQSRIRTTGKTIRSVGGDSKKPRSSGDNNNNYNSQNNRNIAGQQIKQTISAPTNTTGSAKNKTNNGNNAIKVRINNQYQQQSAKALQINQQNNQQNALISDVKDLREFINSKRHEGDVKDFREIINSKRNESDVKDLREIINSKRSETKRDAADMPSLINASKLYSVEIKESLQNQNILSSASSSGIQNRLRRVQNTTNIQKTTTTEHLRSVTLNQQQQLECNVGNYHSNLFKPNSFSNRLQLGAPTNASLYNQSSNNMLPSSSNVATTHLPSQLSSTNLQVNTSSTSVAKPGEKRSIQDRLAIVSPPQQVPFNYQTHVTSLFNTNDAVINKETDKTKQDNENMPYEYDFEFNPDLDADVSLQQYCTVKRIPQPVYKYFKLKYSNRFQCQVNVNERIYSTYPADYATQKEARIACSKEAIEGIQSEAKRKYPVCTDSDPELALKMHQELRNHPNGIFCKNIPEVFESVFNQSLPDHWLSIIETSDQFTSELGYGNNLIVFAKTSNSESSGASTTSDPEYTVMDKIVLPWEEKHWNLWIHNCVSTVEVWSRIVGEQYSDKLDSLMNDIDVYMLTDKTRTTSVSLGSIYLVCVAECWFRVKVVDMNKSDGNCLCFYIDCGDEEWLPMSQLYICEPKFLKLAPQAIQFSLFGLEDFAENPNAKRHLDEMLVGKTLVGEILSKRETFESALDSKENLNPKIQVVLFDTSSKDDVNLNPLIIDKICDDTPPPELRKIGVTNVNVTYISNNGEVFLQVKHKGLLYVQKLINQLVQSKFKEEQYKVNMYDMKRNNLFLIYDISDKMWYRGALAEGEEKISETKYNIFYVDHGMTKPTDITRIFRLESLSAALSKYPRQAIKAKLHNLPPINETIIKRIRGLLHENCPAIVKVAVNALTPHIIIYKRFEHNQALCNINEVIRIEHEIESSSEMTDDLLLDNKVDTGSANDIATNFRNISLKSPINVPNTLIKGGLPKIPENKCIMGVGEKFDVFVPMASNPFNFIVQPLKDGRALLEMINELQEYCLNNNDFIPEDMIEIGQAYAALREDYTYYRVIVENIRDSMIYVYNCDYGDFSVLTNEKLKPLPAKFRTLAKQAFSAKLYGIKPKHLDWDVVDCTRFYELTVGKRFASIIKGITNDPLKPDLRILSLDLIDVSTDDDIYLRKLLITEGHADPA